MYDFDRAKRIVAQCGSAQVFGDSMQLLEAPGIDAIVIVSPDPTHAGFVQACLQNHKPVLCEKPLATTVEDAQAIIEAEQTLDQR